MDIKDIDQRLTAVLAEQMTQGGAAAFALWRNGEIAAECACGADVRDLFCIGSVSKLYCAAAVMVLCERGLIELDAPAAQYLPRFRMADARYKSITVRMLLDHSSGLPGTCVRSGFTIAPLTQKAMEDCLYDYFAVSTLKAEPGTVSVYCNDGYELAELIVAEVSGMPFADFVRQNITGPLGASSTLYTHEQTERRRVNVGGENEVIMLLGAGGVMSDMADLCRFGSIFLPSVSGGGVLTKRGVDEMCSPQGHGMEEDPAASRYGLGWDTVAASAAAVHFGPRFMGLSSAKCGYELGERAFCKCGTTTQIKSILMVLPEYNAACAMAVTLSSGLSRDVLLPELFAVCMDSFGVDVRRPLPASANDFTPADESFSGYYLSGADLIECRVRGDGLAAYACVGEGRYPMLEGLRHTGGGVFSFEGQRACRLVRGADRNYLLAVLESTGMCCVAESAPQLPPIPEAWANRVGSSWICVNSAECDMANMENGAVGYVLRSAEIPNMLVFRGYSPDAHGYVATPFCAVSDQRGGMFQNGPSMSSRDGGEPIVELKRGREELSFSGRRYRSIAELPPAEGDVYILPGDEENIALRLPEREVHFDIPEDGAAIFFDAELSRGASPAPGGIALLLGSAGARFRIVPTD